MEGSAGKREFEAGLNPRKDSVRELFDKSVFYHDC